MKYIYLLLLIFLVACGSRTYPNTLITNTQETIVSGNSTFDNITMTAVLKDKISLYDDRLGASNMYGLGVGASNMYYKSGGNHQFYTNTNYNGVDYKFMIQSDGKIYTKNTLTVLTGDLVTSNGDIYSLNQNTLGGWAVPFHSLFLSNMLYSDSISGFNSADVTFLGAIKTGSSPFGTVIGSNMSVQGLLTANEIIIDKDGLNSAASLKFDKDSNRVSQLTYYEDSVIHWTNRHSSSASGNHWSVRRHDTSGIYVDEPLLINHSTGNVHIENNLTVKGIVKQDITWKTLRGGYRSCSEYVTSFEGASYLYGCLLRPNQPEYTITNYILPKDAIINSTVRFYVDFITNETATTDNEITRFYYRVGGMTKNKGGDYIHSATTKYINLTELNVVPDVYYNLNLFNITNMNANDAFTSLIYRYAHYAEDNFGGALYTLPEWRVEYQSDTP